MPKSDEKKFTAIRAELESVANQNIVDDYNEFLMREYPVEINEKVFNRFFEQ